MRTDHNIARRASEAGNLELVNTLGAALGFAPCTDAASFVALLDGKICAHEAELAKLASMRDAVAKLLRGRHRGPWVPGPNTVGARIVGLLQQHGILTRQQIADHLAAEAAGEVPLGSIAAAMSKLAEEGWIAGGRTGWRLTGADT